MVSRRKRKRKSPIPKDEAISTQNDYTSVLQGMSRDSQNKTVLKHLMEHGSITPREAVNLYDIWRLSARIYDLRDKGIEIETLQIENINTTGTHAKYILREGDK